MLLAQHKTQSLVSAANHILPLHDTRIKFSRTFIPLLHHWEFPIFWWKNNGFFMHDTKIKQNTHLDLDFTRQEQAYMQMLYTLTFIPDIVPGITFKPTILFAPAHVQQILLK